MAVPNASGKRLKLFFFSFQAAHARVRVVADRSTIFKKNLTLSHNVMRSAAADCCVFANIMTLRGR
jgi:hypothetical protein